MSNLAAQANHSSAFQRFVLPGLAFKAVVIGGGYATGREIAEFFLPAGPWGGIAAMAVATVIWCVVCAITFVFARRLRERDYRSFFRALLGRAWPAFEIAYVLFVVLILAVFGAAAGAIASATFGAPPMAGTLLLMAAIAIATAFGNKSVERVFTWVSILLYGVYAAFVVFALTSFGDRISQTFAAADGWNDGWLSGGLTYAGYNIIGAVVILPVTRHLEQRPRCHCGGHHRGPAGHAAGIPLLYMHVCVRARHCRRSAAFGLPAGAARSAVVPISVPGHDLCRAAGKRDRCGACRQRADFDRLAGAHAYTHSAHARAARWRSALLAICMLIADRVGLVALIANGYRALAYVLIAVYVVPLLTIGVWRLWKGGQSEWVTS